MWHNKVTFKIGHQIIITTGIIALLFIIGNGILMASDVFPGWMGWFNIPAAIIMITFIPWGIEKWINE